MKKIILLIIGILVNTPLVSSAWTPNQDESVNYEEPLPHVKMSKKHKVKSPAGNKVAFYQDIDPFDMLTLDTRFNTPMLIRIHVKPNLKKNHLVIKDLKGHANIFDVEQSGRKLSISPRRILDYRVYMELYCNSLRELTSFGDNRIIVSGVNNHSMYLVLSDKSIITFNDGIVRKMYIQANDESKFFGLNLENRFADIFATDLSEIWLNVDYADLKTSKGAIVKCERLPYKHELKTQKTHTFVQEQFTENLDEYFTIPKELEEFHADNF